MSGREGFAQRPMVHGRVMNYFTKETVPFASVFWKKGGAGTTSDSAGNFSLHFSNFANDSLVVSYVGFSESYKKMPRTVKDTFNVELILSELKVSNTVEVKSKFHKGLRWWRMVVQHKAKNNPFQYQNYRYELYNKMELDINNVSRKYFDDKKLLKPFGFILNNIDSVSDRSPFLPVYMTEA